MEYYLIVSAIMFFASIYGFFTPPQYLGDIDFNRVDTERCGHQLRGIQPFSVSRRAGRLFLRPVLYRHLIWPENIMAIAIMINIYRNIRSIQVNKLDELKW